MMNCTLTVHRLSDELQKLQELQELLFATKNMSVIFSKTPQLNGIDAEWLVVNSVKKGE